ncbi:hypothetical protein M8998_07290 [Sphingobacterium sp. lm-10]|uniref:hypothetical protein n=1 Tax=Sphingobacterium sp. lm-10 TaxID=2944904 RepID=UPI00202104D1|nr:hypothetical protein [Sphingobacterium sp. lm-10]MCL7987738.1 hypothetical protein [Sphingobacterium sp. lm-10]
MPKTKSAIRVKDIHGATNIIYTDSIVSYRERSEEKGNVNGTHIELISGKSIEAMIRLDMLIDLIKKSKTNSEISEV